MNNRRDFTKDFRAYKLAGYALVIVGLGGFLGWAFWAQLSAAVIAPGSVVVSSNRKVIQHLEGGIIDQVMVRDGSHVKEGDVLIKFDTTKAKSEYAQLISQQVSGLALEARYEAEQDGLDKVEFPALLHQHAAAGLYDAEKLMKTQATLFVSRKDAVEREIRILDGRVETLQKKVEAFSRQKESLKAEMDSYDAQRSGVSSLAASGFASKNSERELDRRILSLQSAISNADAEIATAESSIVEAQLQKAVIANKNRDEAVAEIAKVREVNAGLSERIAFARDVLARTDLVAPQDGVIQGLRFHAKGAVVNSSEAILELVPVTDDLIVEASLPVLNIDQVHTGMTAEVRFPSFTSRTTPVLFGKVIDISPDALPDAEGQRSTFKGRIEVLKETVPAELVAKLQAGMMAEIVIPTEERSVMSYLVRPLVDAFAKTFREK